MTYGLATLKTHDRFSPSEHKPQHRFSVCLFVLMLCAPGFATAAQHKNQKPHKASKTKVLIGKAFGNTVAVKALAQRLSAERQLPKAWVQQNIATAHLLPQVQQMVLPPNAPTAKTGRPTAPGFCKQNAYKRALHLRAYMRMRSSVPKNAMVCLPAMCLACWAWRRFLASTKGSSRCWMLWQH